MKNKNKMMLPFSYFYKGSTNSFAVLEEHNHIYCLYSAYGELMIKRNCIVNISAFIMELSQNIYA